VNPLAALVAASAVLDNATCTEATCGVGIDLVDLVMMRDLLASGGQAFLDLAWTPAEQAETDGVAERLGARWAAKEAVMKALQAGLGEVDPLDIQVLSSPGGAPYVDLSNSASAAAEAVHAIQVHVSMSHENDWAAAVAIAVRERTSAAAPTRTETADG
jgi:holo-[acyl-carrier protein] synthase